MPSTVTSLNSGDCISSACDDDDHLPPTLTTTTPVAAEASSHKNDGAQRMHIKELFTKIFWGFHQFWDIAEFTSNNREEAADLASIQWNVPKIPIPSLTIAILVVGTYGDIQPFLAIGHKLKEMGHSVRLATHRDYEDLVKIVGLDFFPLGGDPKKLSSFMVETSGCRSIPKIFNKRKLLTQSMKVICSVLLRTWDDYRSPLLHAAFFVASSSLDIFIRNQMMDEIIQSTWSACTAPYPDDLGQKPWIADAIISNPVCFGHLHCAEALSVPLHLFFPQPWTPTSEFPHPLSGLSYDKGWRIENWYSYHVMDWVLLEGFGTSTNNLRRSIGLEPVRAGEHGYSYIFDNKVPFAKIWSVSLVPKPKDWGPHIDVVGNIFLDEEIKSNALEPNFSPPSDLVDFLKNGAPPIFVGFGSMVIEDTSSLVRIISEAVKGSGERVILQSNWSTFCNSTDHIDDSIYFAGSVPHEWLFPRVAAVVHHGGAGTVAAGLKAGKPTMICPFFGDQFFWGHYCYKRGVGPKPLPFSELTSSKLIAGFEILRLESVHKSAEAMARAFSCENGVEEGVRCFFKHLPLKHMVCDVSLYLKGDRPLIARRWCQDCELKLSVLADEAIHSMPENKGHRRNEYRFMKWAVKGPGNPLDGAKEGVLNLLHELAGGISDFVRLPFRGARKNNAVGAMKGLSMGVINLVQRPIRGGVLLVDKCVTGMLNFVRVQSKRIKRASPLAQTEIEMVEGPTVRRYTVYSGIMNRELTMKEHLFGGTNGVTQQNVGRARAKVVKGNENEVYQEISDEELMLAFTKVNHARKFFNTLSAGKPIVRKEKVIVAVYDLINDNCVKLNGDCGGSSDDGGGKDVATPDNIESIANKIEDTTGCDEYMWYE